MGAAGVCGASRCTQACCRCMQACWTAVPGVHERAAALVLCALLCCCQPVQLQLPRSGDTSRPGLLCCVTTAAAWAKPFTRLPVEQLWHRSSSSPRERSRCSSDRIVSAHSCVALVQACINQFDKITLTICGLRLGYVLPGSGKSARS